MVTVRQFCLSLCRKWSWNFLTVKKFDKFCCVELEAGRYPDLLLCKPLDKTLKLAAASRFTTKALPRPWQRGLGTAQTFMDF